MNGVKAKPTSKDDADMIANLDLLMNLDIAESESDWSLVSNDAQSKDSMPTDLPDDTGGEQ
jgi:hypothetical protein